MTDLTFNVNGTPGAQGSKTHKGNGVMVESSKKVKPWRTDVKTAAETAIAAVEAFDPWTPYAGPVHVTVLFRFPRPKSHYRTGRNAHLLRDNAPAHPVGRNLGDIDKLARSTFDALTAAGVIADDSLIVATALDKHWCDDGQPAGARIYITSLTSERAA